MDHAVAAWADALPPGHAADGRAMLDLFAAVSGFPPRMWGTMVGFGRYAYRYDSGHGGEAFATGLAHRGREFALYVLQQADVAADLARLGRHRTGKVCLYLPHPAAVDQAALGRIIRAGLDDLATRWPIRPG